MWKRPSRSARRGFRRTLGLLFSIVLIATACGDDDAESTTTTAPAAPETTAAAAPETTAPAAPETTAAAAPVAGGTFTLGVFEDLESFDQEQTVGNAMTFVVHDHLYEYVASVSEDGTTVVPGTAESWEFSDDLLTLTFTIRQGIKFHDGSDLTAQDVRFSLERAQAAPNYGFQLEGVESIETPDDFTVVLNLVAPNTELPTVLASTYAPLYPEDWGGRTEDEYFTSPVGSGPFKYNDWIPGDRVVLDAFTEYWGGAPKIDQLVLRIFADANAAVIAYEDGVIDAVDSPPLDSIGSLPGTIMATPQGGSQILALNGRTPPFDNANARRALAYAIDYQELVDGAALGYAQVPISFGGPVDAFDHFAAPDTSFTYDPDRAREELAAAGTPDGYEAVMHIPAGDSVIAAAAQIIAGRVADVGIDVDIQILDIVTLYDIAFEGGHQASWVGYSIIIPSLSDYVGFYAGTEGTFGGYDMTEVFDMLAEIQATTDPATKREVMRRFENFNVEEAIVIPLYHSTHVMAVSDRVEGLSVGLAGFPLKLEYVSVAG